MTRNITAAFRTELNAESLRPAVLVKGGFDSGDLNLWTGVGDIVFDGDTYQGTGNLLNIEQIQETQKLQANGVVFVMNGAVDALVSIALSESYQWRPISAWLAVLDEDFQLIADPHKIFSGKMDVMEISDNGEASTIAVNAESNLIDLQNSRETRYTNEDQLARFPGDVGLQFMPNNSDVEITWGSGQ